jgi:O-antigen ligase
MKTVNRSAGVMGEVGMTGRLTSSPSLSWRQRVVPLLFLLALLLGGAIPWLTTLPSKWLGVLCVGLCGLFGILFWWSANWPLAPALRLGLLASFSMRLETQLFGLDKDIYPPPGITISLTFILSVMLAVAYLNRRRPVGQREKIFPVTFSLALSTLFLWCVISVISSEQTWLGISALWSLTSMILMCFVVAWAFADSQALRQGVVGMAITVALSCIVGLLQYQFDLLTDITALGAAPEEDRLKIAEGGIIRVYGFLWHANIFAWFLVSYMPVIIAMPLLRAPGFRPWERWLFPGVSALSLIALILTYARGGWIAFAVGSALLVVLTILAIPKTERWRLILKLQAVIILTGCLCLPFTGSIYTRLTEDDAGAAYTRVPLMQVAMEMIRHNPLLGVGLNNYNSQMRRYDNTPELVSDEILLPVHNVFLHIAAEAGAPALLCFLILTAVALREGWRAFRQSDDLFTRAVAAGLIAGFTAYLLTGFKEPGSLGYPQIRLFFLLSGLLIAVGRVDRRRVAGDQKPKQVAAPGRSKN